MQNYTIFIQKYNGEFAYDFCYTAYEGFKYRGNNIKFFEYLDDVPVSKYHVVIGSIEVTSEYFKRLGIEVPSPLNIPFCLAEYTQRNINIIEMGEFRKNETFPIFVKPHSKLKEFSAGVLSKKSSIDMFFNDVPNDSIVLTSEVVNMVSEYRVFVKDNKIVGIKNYIGDFLVFPDIPTILNMIHSYVGSPSAYTLDVAIDDKGETILIECNDGWSVGSYGLDGEVYASFLIKRWVELVTS
jgi:hypothetical protein